MNDDLDEEVIDTHDEFDEFSQKSTLGDTIRRSPVAKVIIVVSVIGLLGVVAVMFGGEKEDPNISILEGGSDVTSVPGGTEEVAPIYAAAVEEQNEAVLEEALTTGGSAIPVPVPEPNPRLEVPEVEETSLEDPLHRWRQLQEERIERQTQSRQSGTEPVTVLDAEQQSEAITALSESMMQQMESVLSRGTETKKFTTKTLISYKDNDSDGTNAGSGESSGSAAANFTEIEEEEVIIPAGKIVYGQMLLEANSDVPFTVMAQMVSGPLKGWKLLGQFSVLDDLGMLGITFDVAVNKEGKQHSVNAVMLNPDTGLAAMRTDIDHRYLRRIVFPAAAAFVSGYASAIAESGRTTVTVSGDTVIDEENGATDKQEVATGVQEAGEEISDILDDMGDVPVKIVIAAGTPIGVFFTENVVDTDGEGI